VRAFLLIVLLAASLHSLPAQASFCSAALAKLTAIFRPLVRAIRALRGCDHCESPTELVTLKEYEAANARVKAMTSELGVDRKKIAKLPREEQLQAFVTEVSKKLNESGHNPLFFLRDFVHRNPELKEIYAELEAQITARGLTVEWGSDMRGSFINGQTIRVNPLFLYNPKAGLSTLMHLKHELSHRPNLAFDLAEGRATSQESHIKKHYSEFLEDEVDAIMGEFDLVIQLYKMGLLKLEDLEPMRREILLIYAQKLEPAKSREMVKDEVAKTYRKIIENELKNEWMRLYVASDIATIADYIKTKSPDEFLPAVQALLSASPRRKLEQNPFLYDQAVISRMITTAKEAGDVDSEYVQRLWVVLRSIP
jgi:hypothetical protein